jgi:ubiquitin carboxyl-terminal hydrolase 8
VSAAILQRVFGHHIPIFGDNQEHDAHLFLLSFLETICEDLNQSLQARGQRLPPGLTGIELHKACQRSWISDLFHGFITVRTSWACGHQKEGIEAILTWELPMPQGKSPITLADCIAQWGAEKTYDGRDSPFCDECNTQVAARKKYSVWRFSPVLVIQLHRFVETSQGIEKDSRPVEYPLEFPATFENDPKVKPSSYKLFAVVTHTGTVTDGKYATLTSNRLDPLVWYQIVDTQVQVVTPAEAQTSDAYILFYERHVRREPKKPANKPEEP